MLFAQPTIYAIKALCVMSREYHGLVVKSRVLASALHINEAYLGKVLSLLARRGLLNSHRGPAGGYQLTAQPDEISLKDILAACDDLDGLNGSGAAGVTAPDEYIHHYWSDLWSKFQEEATEIVRDVTLEDLVKLMIKRTPETFRGQRPDTEL